jgi:hypothetical protein
MRGLVIRVLVRWARRKLDMSKVAGIKIIGEYEPSNLYLTSRLHLENMIRILLFCFYF